MRILRLAALAALCTVSLAVAGPEAGSGSDRDSWADFKEDLLKRFPNMTPRVGDLALDHTGIDLDGNPVHLAELWARKPVVLEFGTCT